MSVSTNVSRIIPFPQLNDTILIPFYRFISNAVIISDDSPKSSIKNHVENNGNGAQMTLKSNEPSSTTTVSDSVSKFLHIMHNKQIELHFTQNILLFRWI